MKKSYREMLDRITKEHEKFQSASRDSRVLIVDGTNLFIRTFSVVPVMNDDGIHIGGMIGFLRSLSSVIQSVHPTRVVIVFDGKGGSLRRKRMYTDYKQGRAAKKNINRVAGFEDLEDSEKSMQWQMVRLIHYLKVLPVTNLIIDHVEADDVIAHLATTKFLQDVVIMSSDKDFLQLVSPRISVWSTSKKQMYTANEVMSEFNVSPENFILYKCLMGDSSDNIKKVLGVGEKFIEKNLNILLERRLLSHEELLDFCTSQKDTARGYAKIIEQWETFQTNYRLMQLADVDISLSIKNKIDHIVDTTTIEFDKVQLRRELMSDKAINAMQNLDSWMYSFDKIFKYRDKV